MVDTKICPCFSKINVSFFMLNWMVNTTLIKIKFERVSDCTQVESCIGWVVWWNWITVMLRNVFLKLTNFEKLNFRFKKQSWWSIYSYETISSLMENDLKGDGKWAPVYHPNNANLRKVMVIFLIIFSLKLFTINSFNYKHTNGPLMIWI